MASGTCSPHPQSQNDCSRRLSILMEGLRASQTGIGRGELTSNCRSISAMWSSPPNTQGHQRLHTTIDHPVRQPLRICDFRLGIWDGGSGNVRGKREMARRPFLSRRSRISRLEFRGPLNWLWMICDGWSASRSAFIRVHRRLQGRISCPAVRISAVSSPWFKEKRDCRASLART